MKLRESLRAGRSPVSFPRAPRARAPARGTYYTVKGLVHTRLVEKLDLDSVSETPKDVLASTIRQTLEEIISSERLPLNRAERSKLIGDLLDEILGLGPIEAFMADDEVQDIVVNGYANVFVEKDGILHPTAVQFRDNEHLMQVIDKIVSRVGRRVDESSPMVDARLPDGSRVNVIIPPIALDGPMLSIRKFGHNVLTQQQVTDNLTMTPELMAYLKAAIQTKLNVLISGGTGAVKTTLLNILSGHIPVGERIVTIEDSAELRLHQPHVVRLESRPPNIESKGEITLTDLVKNSLRMRPDRIIVGETRGAEIIDMLQAMNTGHPGSMSTIHANSPRDAFARMEVMIGMGHSILSEHGARALVASAINIIVQLARLPDGRRRVTSISEITGLDGDTITTQEIFEFEQESVDEKGRILGCFKATGAESIFLQHMRTHGMELPAATFDLHRPVR